jgi:3-methyladenine DNA glycosylase AlkC
MAPRWRDSYGPWVIEWVAEALGSAHPALDREAFMADCVPGYDDLELMDRARRIADVMGDHLPADPHESVPIITASLGPIEPGLSGMVPFRYLPMVLFVGSRGLGAFEESMTAQYELTRRFTAEFSIRPFLEQHRDATLARLRLWTADPDPHVRRLVSEGTRPRLPWAPRLQQFVADPAPVLELLELLRDDNSEYVRRSIANNLNDIAKDHPDLVVEVARRWWSEGGGDRQRMVRHGLRTLVKRGDPGALEVLGLADAADLVVTGSTIAPTHPAIGERVRIEVEVTDRRTAGQARPVAVDVVVHFVKANGATSHRVFKGGVRALAPGAAATYSATVSVAQHSTRTHYTGVHAVEAQVNGQRSGIGAFTLREA